mmetsp:Transcript_2605/g.4195  ORF Transcript_2605/g.4195 Transcript_2605/m.4195 type:complete len:271 (-) Transcript_2605:1756-2568(-)|eukprot:CAMPEP_0184304882 /NCGR_PEP_ID=MMETSP1049-20130417/14292_1 /TAXON_ID=77928 /ORGANISM="Proteomonas sulcata, Strain CCMP704" /LENGTH=270 /DNA_ID=CAMNT_0026616811 /DNA_START=148 /DNA_END=960 /DNA_ORIENTATION=-
MKASVVAAALLAGLLGGSDAFLAPSAGIGALRARGFPAVSPSGGGLGLRVPKAGQNAAAARFAPSMALSVNIPITVSGNNIELTNALKEYATEKLGSTLSKVGRRVTKCEVHLTVDKNPTIEKPQTAEVVVSVKGTVIRAAKSTHDMYASLDEVSDSIRRKLRKYKERIIDAHRKGKPEAEEFELSEIEDFKLFNDEVAREESEAPPVPEVDMSLVKKKSFPMDPISVEEAVLCLEYIDHDFYVFKNKENGKIGVVYKRGSGGVGLIEPE